MHCDCCSRSVETRDVDGLSVCDRCLEDRFSRCHVCGQWYDADDPPLTCLSCEAALGPDDDVADTAPPDLRLGAA